MCVCYVYVCVCVCVCVLCVCVCAKEDLIFSLDYNAHKLHFWIDIHWLRDTPTSARYGENQSEYAIHWFSTHCQIEGTDVIDELRRTYDVSMLTYVSEDNPIIKVYICISGSYTGGGVIGSDKSHPFWA